MYEQLIDLAEWGTSESKLVYCATIRCVPLTKTTSTLFTEKAYKFSEGFLQFFGCVNFVCISLPMLSGKNLQANTRLKGTHNKS
jgi:hypothetical protein